LPRHGVICPARVASPMQSAFFPQGQGAGGPRSPDRGSLASRGSAGSPPDSAERARSSGGPGAGAGAAPRHAKPAYAYAYGGGGPGAPTRGPRFPSSRRYLWDRTPAGAQVLVSTADLLPQLSISASALAALAAAAAAGAAPAFPLQLSFAATNTYQLTGLLQGADAGPGGAPLRGSASSVRATVALLPAGDAAGDGEALLRAGGGEDALAAAVAAHLDTLGPARVAEVGLGSGAGRGWMTRAEAGLCCSTMAHRTLPPTPLADPAPLPHRSCSRSASAPCPPHPRAPRRRCSRAPCCPAAACC
jgi:hypothetical protein